jgi:hypothetical protein
VGAKHAEAAMKSNKTVQPATPLPKPFIVGDWVRGSFGTGYVDYIVPQCVGLVANRGKLEVHGILYDACELTRVAAR